MVMKVLKANPVVFRSTQVVTKPEKQENKKTQISELNSVTPDFAVKMPQKYSLLGVEKTNGLNIHSYKLANGYRVTVVPMENSPVMVKNYVNVGALNENDKIKGISHFLEHMAFNGTNGTEGYTKLESGDTFKRIDKIGGWTNASTGYALTDYVNSSPLLEPEDLEEQLKVIAAMTEDLALTDEMIEKEKGPVCSEINMILDDPQTTALDQNVRTLFNINSSADELIGGSVEHIKNLTREDVKAYYDKYYTPDNMNLVITGDVDPQETIELVSKLFKSNKVRKGEVYEERLTPINKTVRKDFISDKAKSTEIVLGFVGPKNNDIKSQFISEIVARYLAQTTVGIRKELKTLNADGGIGMDNVSTNPNAPSYLYYGVTCSDENSEKVLKILFDKLSNLKTPDEETVQKIKDKMNMGFKDDLEYSHYINNEIGRNVLLGLGSGIPNYEEIFDSITVEDVERFCKEYLDVKKTAVTLVHPKVETEEILKNYEEASKISFKAKKRKPMNVDKVSETTLENNCKLGFYNSKSDNVYFQIKYLYDGKDENINPVAKKVLAHIYGMGTKYMSEEELDKYEEDNNIRVSTSIKSKSMNIKGASSYANFGKTINKARELIYHPRITQEQMDDAIKNIKDSIKRRKPSAKSLYIANESKINPMYISAQQTLAELDKLTLKDIEDTHQYLLKNSKAVITVNIPEGKPEFKEETIKEFGTLSKVQPYEYQIENVYVENTKPQILTKAYPVSQADIMQTYKFPLEMTPKEMVTASIMNKILSSSSSIGLFNTLREKEHLAYSVHSYVDTIGNSGELSCRILTTTDNKDIGEISYDNVEKSITGFHRQIQKLIDSEYTDEDLESAKRIYKADLLDNEGVTTKLMDLMSGLTSKEGFDLVNQEYEVVDTITREDIQNFANKVFKNPPIYSIVASKDTLDANKEFLDSLNN
ncbi:MAG: insulinase family protein [Cyanobacteria bacterium SIG28]|nr:insulinase family protein [Cyanobacteria bacterium SIG28]